MILVLFEVAFPHGVHVLLKDVVSGKELRVCVRDDDIFSMLPRGERQALMGHAEALIRQGRIGKDLAAVHRVPLRGPAQTILTSEFKAGAESFEVSVAKAAGSAQLTVGIARASAAGALMLHFCDHGASAAPLSLYGGVHDVGGARLLVLAALDQAPLAWRLAVVDAARAQPAFEAVLADAGANDSGSDGGDGPADAAAAADHAAGRAGAREPLAAREDLAAALAAVAPGPLREAPLDAGARPRPCAAPPGSGASRVLHRLTRTLPSGQVVLLSIVRECLPDGSISRLRVVMLDMATAQEASAFVLNPQLDKVLRACNVGDSWTATAKSVDEAGKDVARYLMPLISVHSVGTGVEIRSEAPAGSTSRSQPEPGH